MARALRSYVPSPDNIAVSALDGDGEEMELAADGGGQVAAYVFKQLSTAMLDE